jgi:hypothetical protein
MRIHHSSICTCTFVYIHSVHTALDKTVLCKAMYIVWYMRYVLGPFFPGSYIMYCNKARFCRLHQPEPGHTKAATWHPVHVGAIPQVSSNYLLYTRITICGNMWHDITSKSNITNRHCVCMKVMKHAIQPHLSHCLNLLMHSQNLHMQL